ncbi:GNAT family N-acetyltransferase [Flavobacterium algicola]|uniref:GNAT family N-acetyltransferase n=1 Tax=Flavobacterium algicola TaxID=556529 RepID=UPI001EFDA767|nr:GNAT family N-acetyltransferase [Flavobacterium algicola]MCG9794066.1 GNAT family N-acetyltransferase [Flavobacterium algicola]
MVIRKGNSNDMEAVLELIQELADFEKEPDAVEITVANLKADGFGSNPLFELFVAEKDSKIIGMALYYYKYSTWKGKSIHLEDLIVTESERGNGIGNILLEQMVALAQEENIKRLEWNVLDWNTPAIEFYQKFGAEILKEWQLVRFDEARLKNFTKKNN